MEEGESSLRQRNGGRSVFQPRLPEPRSSVCAHHNMTCASNVFKHANARERTNLSLFQQEGNSTASRLWSWNILLQAHETRPLLVRSN